MINVAPTKHGLGFPIEWKRSCNTLLLTNVQQTILNKKRRQVSYPSNSKYHTIDSFNKKHKSNNLTEFEIVSFIH